MSDEKFNNLPEEVKKRLSRINKRSFEIFLECLSIENSYIVMGFRTYIEFMMVNLCNYPKDKKININDSKTRREIIETIMEYKDIIINKAETHINKFFKYNGDLTDEFYGWIVANDYHCNTHYSGGDFLIQGNEHQDIFRMKLNMFSTDNNFIKYSLWNIIDE